MELKTKAFGWSEIRGLLKKGEGPHVSIYLPLHDEWTDKGADGNRLRHLLKDIEARLLEGGLRKSETDEMLAPGRSLADDRSFWRTGAPGAAVFIARGLFQAFHLSIEPDELVTVSGQFHTRNLMRQLSTDGRFFIVALSRESMRLFEAERYHIQEHELEDTPVSLEEAMKYDEFEKHSGVHGRSGRGAQSGVHHGTGGASDGVSHKRHVRRFVQAVDNGVRAVLAGESAPLVLVGLDELRGMYRDANHYRHLLDEDIDRNPDGLSREELHELVWPVVEPRFRKAANQAREQFQRLASLAPERVTGAADQAAEAAYFRRIDTLILPETGRVWGRIDPETGKAEMTDEPNPRVDLLDFAAGQTLLSGGRIFTMDASRIPGEGHVAAILRY